MRAGKITNHERREPHEKKHPFSFFPFVPFVYFVVVK